MIQDIFTVVWKEWRSIFRFPGGRLRFAMLLLSPLIIVVWLPAQLGHVWIDFPIPMLFLSCVVPLLIVGLLIPESFAGERERGTLETLLASRLPDLAILAGKLGFAVLFSMLTVILLLGTGSLVLNAFHWTGRYVFHSAGLFGFALLLSAGSAVLIGSLGILISMQSNTTQEANQRLMAFFMIPLTIGGVLAMAFMRPIIEGLETMAGPVLAASASGAILLFAALTLLLALLRFRRARLVSLP